VFATAALALVSPPQVAIPAVMLVADTLAIPMLWAHRRHLDRALLRTVPPFTRASLTLLIAGLILGAFLLGHVPPAGGRVALAIVVLGFVALQVRRWRGAARPARPARWWSGIGPAAFGGGLVDGWLSTGGVVIAMFLTARRLAPDQFVTAIVTYFLATDAIRALTYAVLGYWTAGAVALYLRTAPIALAGYAVGTLLRRFLASDRIFRAVVLILLAAYAVALIARAAFAR
jgi:uncharacterized membrane protein YfcA